MRVEVDLDKCTGHGICESIAEDVFEVQDDGTVHDPRERPAGVRPRPDAAGRNPVPRSGFAAGRLSLRRYCRGRGYRASAWAAHQHRLLDARRPHPSRRTACRSSCRCRRGRSWSPRGCRSTRLGNPVHVHDQVGVHERPLPDVELRADAVGVVGDREQPLQRRHGLALDEIDLGLIHDSPGPLRSSARSAIASRGCARSCGPSPSPTRGCGRRTAAAAAARAHARRPRCRWSAAAIRWPSRRAAAGRQARAPASRR